MRVPAPGSWRPALTRPACSPWPPRRAAARFRALLRNHWIFVCFLVPAVALRADTMLGYRYQLWFNDSFIYVSDAVDFHLDPTRPSGYAIFLKIFEPLHSYALITSLQHCMGLAIGVMVYALARRRFGAPAWVASLAAVPVFYDGFQIQLEHLIMADVPFEFLIMLAATIVLWEKHPSLRRYVLAGLLIGVSDLIRSVGLPLLAVLVVYMVVERAQWRAVAGAIVACALPLIAYASVFDAEHGQFALTNSTGVFLYQRVMAFANCNKMKLPADELPLCVTTPVSKRPISQEYLWANMSPLNRYPPSKFSSLPNKLGKNFAVTAIEDQPLGYARTVWHDTWRVFGWKRTIFPDAATYDEYLFSRHPLGIPGWAGATVGPYHSYAAAYAHSGGTTKVAEPFAGFMRAYQRYGYLPGTLYGVILLIGLGGMVLDWRRAGGRARLPWLFSVALIVVPAATAEFDYRYVLPAVPFGCLAAAMAFGQGAPARRILAGMRRGNAPGRAGDPGASPAEGETEASGVSAS